MRVVVLGAGFGGLELCTRLSRSLGDSADVVLIDRTAGFVFGFAKLDVMFGRVSADSVVHRYASFAKAGVRFVQTTVREIDPGGRRVQTDDGAFDADVLVVALGAELHPEATPGLMEGGIDFYSESSAFAAREVLQRFEGGRVVVGVTSTPFKCPPAPSEAALLMHSFLDVRGLRASSELALVSPLPTPIPPSPEASAVLVDAFAERGIEWHPNTLVREVDPAAKMLRLADGGEMPFDLFLAVPQHRVPSVVQEYGLAVDGWIPVDPRTLETSFAGVYAIGDVTSVGTPKAGVFAEGQAAVVAERITARARGVEPTTGYAGRGVCYLEFGDDRIAMVDVTFEPGTPPHGTFVAPSSEAMREKRAFGDTRIERWFG
jgi:sulfide:quinone oxidoreductase